MHHIQGRYTPFTDKHKYQVAKSIYPNDDHNMVARDAITAHEDACVPCRAKELRSI